MEYNFDNNDINKKNIENTSKKRKIEILIGGLCILLFGCFLTFITFFFFGPFLGSPFLIGGVVFISNYVFNNKIIKIVMSVVLSILFILLISIAAYFFGLDLVKKTQEILWKNKKSIFIIL